MQRLLFVIVALLLASSMAQDQNPRVPTPVQVTEGAEITFNDVFPSVDQYLRQTYWYYLRSANIVYQANVNTANTFLFFVIYRNIVGTFLVITTWEKEPQTTQVNTFVRLGNGYAEGSGALYGPVNIDPFVISLQLGEGEFMVTINEDGTITVTGDAANSGEGEGQIEEFDINADMDEKCGFVDASIREKYWYYLRGADLIHASHTPTNERYYCVMVYVNIVGTFLVIGNWELETERVGVNTFVRLGNGFAPGSEALYGPVNYEPIRIEPAVLEMENFGN